MSDSHLDITSHNPSMVSHPSGAKPQASRMLIPHCLPPCQQGWGGQPCTVLWGQTTPQHHLHLWVSPFVCLSLSPGKVSGEQAPHGPDAVLLTASAGRPAGETPGTTTGDGAFRGERVPTGERA